MALIKCTECGQVISDKATVCPRCGCPIGMGNGAPHNANMNQQPMNQPNMNQQSMNQPYMNQQPMNQQPYYNNGNRGNNNGWLYGIIAFLVAALIFGGYLFWDKSKQAEADSQEKIEADSITRDSNAKVEDVQQETQEQVSTETEKKQTTTTATTQTVVTAAPKYYGQVSDPDGYTNIRRGPGTNYPIVRQYNSGDYLYYTPQSNGWSMVYSGVKASNFMGYMHTSRIVKVNPNSGSSYSTSNTNSYPSGNYHEGYIVDPVDNYVNIRKGPGTNYAIVGRLDTYTSVYYTTTGSKWYKVYDGNYNYLGYVFHDRIKKTR